jgi:hypothetical protein
VSRFDSAEKLRSSGSHWNTSPSRLVRPLKETSRCLIPEVPREDGWPLSTPLRLFWLRSSTRSRGMRSSSGGTSSVQRVPGEVEDTQHVQAVQRPRRDGASKTQCRRGLG